MARVSMHHFALLKLKFNQNQIISKKIYGGSVARPAGEEVYAMPRCYAPVQILSQYLRR
jgi:hypothetical protein